MKVLLIYDYLYSYYISVKKVADEFCKSLNLKAFQ